MIKVNEDGFVSARDVHNVLEIKERFSAWIKNALDFFENDYDVRRSFAYTSNNQKLEDFLLPIDMAKEICMTSKNGKELRRYLLLLDSKKEDGLLLGHGELLSLMDIIKASFIAEFRKLARSKHLDKYLPSKPVSTDYAQANIKRNTVCDIDRKELEDKLKSLNKKLVTIEKGIIQVDKYDLIRIAIVDTMIHFGKSTAYAKNVANLAKELAKKDSSLYFDKQDTLYSLPKEYQSTLLMLN